MENAKTNLYQKILSVMSVVKGIEKTAKIKMGKGSYTAVEHDEVTRALHDPIVKSGIVVIPTMDSCEVVKNEYTNSYGEKKQSYEARVWASVSFINSDDPTEKVTTKSFAHAIDNGDKAPGKAYSMAVKYCYLKPFMLESFDNEEARDSSPASIAKPTTRAEAITPPLNHSNTVGDYVFPVGKYKGQTIGQVGMANAKAYAEYFEKKGNVTGWVASLINVLKQE